MLRKVLSKNMEHPKTLFQIRPVFPPENVFAELLDSRNVKPRFGTIGKHGAISVTERVTKTLKYERLKRVPIIKGYDHLAMLREEFECWYNSWRPHMTLDGLRPDDVDYNKRNQRN